MASVGVVYAPFQGPTVDSNFLNSLRDDYIVVVLPVKRYPNSYDSPLDFTTRRLMIQEKHPSILVLPLADEKDPVNFVRKLETLVSEAFSPMPSAFLYASKETLALYEGNGGKWKNTHVMSGTGVETALQATVLQPLKSEDFRRGVIFGIRSRFPISWMTVDMAIVRQLPNESEQILLGMKPAEKLWRFPGGFKDRQDITVEDAVLREALEEVLPGETDPTKFLSAPRYLGSRNVNDWRYRGDKDGITTLLYEVRFFGNPDAVHGGDDLSKAKWFSPLDVKPEMLVPEHRHLWKLYLDTRSEEVKQALTSGL